MATCEICGNDYDKAFEVVTAGVRHTFDSFECAIHCLAPICEHCQCKVLGHGTEVDGQFFCSAHCARAATGADAVQDRIDLTRCRTASTCGSDRRPLSPRPSSGRAA